VHVAEAGLLELEAITLATGMVSIIFMSAKIKSLCAETPVTVVGTMVQDSALSVTAQVGIGFLMFDFPVRFPIFSCWAN
jgi:hypothetical protein